MSVSVPQVTVDLAYETLVDKAKNIQNRYKAAHSKKSYVSQWFVAAFDLREDQIAVFDKLINGVNRLHERCIQPEKFSSEFNLSALRGCYYATLKAIQKTYTCKPEKFINSQLVKILMADLNISALPSDAAMATDLKHYAEAIAIIEVAEKVSPTPIK